MSRTLPAVALGLLATLVLFTAGPVCSASPTKASAAPVVASAGDEDDVEQLDALFVAADQAPAGVVPLILEASAAIARADGDTGHELAERLEPYCRRAFFSPERLPGGESLGLTIHEMASGQLPGRIARAHRVGDGLFDDLNEGYDPRRLQVGQKLKLIDLSDKSLRIVVDRARFRVAAWRKAPDDTGWILMAYLAAGLGALETPTPTGETQVTERVLDPPWTHPVTKVTLPHGHPENVLGGYWMRLAEEGLGKSGIGFHGYTGDEPEAWIGRQASNGCVRLQQRDIERLFHLALEGTPVTITN